MLRAFPVIYAHDVERMAGFYESLGYQRSYQFPAEGAPEYVGLRYGDYDLGIVNAATPKKMLGIDAGSQPRFEMFVNVANVEANVARLRGAGVRVLREPTDMPWGERIAYVADPEGNPVALSSLPPPTGS